MEPIRREIEIAATPDHAFATWTERCSIWWPASHSVSQSTGFEVVFEPQVGGRIYERSPDGSEYEWGKVTVWDPPSLLEYRWHIFLGPEQATMVRVSFSPTEGGSRVLLTNSGFEVFGEEAGTSRAERVGGAWRSLIDLYVAAL